MAKTPEKYLKNVKEGKITGRMLEECIYLVNKRIKHCRGKEIEYGKTVDFTEEKEKLNKQKEILLTAVKPIYICRKFLMNEIIRIYDYDKRYKDKDKYSQQKQIIWEGGEYDFWGDRYIYYFDIKTNIPRYKYYLLCDINNKKIYCPITIDELEKYKDLKIIETNYSKTENYDMNDLISCQFCAKVVKLIENGNYIFEE